MSSPIELAPDIAERARFALDRKKDARSGEHEFWGIGRGDYSSFYAYTDQPSRIDKYEFQGLEVVVANQIRELIKSANKLPIIIMDFGGLVGTSLLRLAGSPDFRNLVEQGKLLFVVTNLNFDIEEGIRSVGIGYNNLSESEIDFINENKKYVNYIKADASELKHIKVRSLFAKEEISLYGNVDIICERAALRHGVKNDTDMFLLSKMMSNEGVMFIGSKGIHPHLKASPQVDKGQEIAHSIGFSNILNSGFSEYQPAKASLFRVFERPGKLRVNI